MTQGSLLQKLTFFSRFGLSLILQPRYCIELLITEGCPRSHATVQLPLELSIAEVMQRIGGNTWMIIRSAMPGGFRSVMSRYWRLYRSYLFDACVTCPFVLGAEFMFGLYPVHLLAPLRPTGFFPNLIGPACNVLMADYIG